MLCESLPPRVPSLCAAAAAAKLALLQDPRDDVSGEKLVASDMLEFLQEFFEGEDKCVRKSECVRDLVGDGVREQG